ncbi:MAG: DUF4145 domain-containing protein, partial [Devosia sp.]
RSANGIDGWRVDAKPLLEVPDFWTSIEKHASGEPFLEGEISYHQPIINLFISRCYECNRLSIWRHDSLIWPARADAPEANPDLPPHVAADFNEAGAVLAISPRAAAALLRLCIQKLCAFLGEKGRNIDDDIASLVAKGLDPRVKKALDIVRVVGNEAVHPGTMDLKDDRATAEELFRLVNLIAEIMISQPKHIAEMYATLPPAKLEAIERRDQKVIEPPKADE